MGPAALGKRPEKKWPWTSPTNSQLMSTTEASESAWEGLASTWSPEIAGGVYLALQLGFGVPKQLPWVLLCSGALPGSRLWS